MAPSLLNRCLMESERRANTRLFFCCCHPTRSSAAFAAPKHTVRPATKIERQVPANAYLSFGSVRPSEPSNMKIQDIGFKESLGD